MLKQLVTKSHASIYLIFISWGMTAVMMWPSATAVFMLFCNLGVLFLLRFVAHLEARADHD